MSPFYITFPWAWQALQVAECVLLYALFISLVLGDGPHSWVFFLLLLCLDHLVNCFLSPHKRHLLREPSQELLTGTYYTPPVHSPSHMTCNHYQHTCHPHLRAKEAPRSFRIFCLAQSRDVITACCR